MASRILVTLSFFVLVSIHSGSPSVLADEPHPPGNTGTNSAEIQVPVEETLEGTVERVVTETLITPEGATGPQLYQKLDIRITAGSLSGKSVTVENGNLPMSNIQKYRVGDRLVLSYLTGGPEADETIYITDFVRRGALTKLFILFVILVIIIGRWQGVSSLIGMAISFAVLFSFILPRISAGNDPVLIAVVGSLMIIPATFLLSHGMNRKTGIAIIGTVIALIITGLLASYFLEAAKLTGFASEEASFLATFRPGIINIRGLLLAGIIIGVLGVLDDITVSQSAIVSQLKETNPSLTSAELYRKAMMVGKDHIASMVNTLVLVYTGAALPLLLLFIDNPLPFTHVVNYEIISDEIVRTLVGSIGLVLAVPITTFLASVMAET